MTGRRIPSVSDDEGSILPLVIFFAFLSLVLILIVVSASSLYLERKRLFTVADGAALAGAESFDLNDVTVTSSGPRPTLTNDGILAAVDDYVDPAPPGELESLTVESASTLDGRSATVTLSAYWRPPVLSILVPDGLRLEVTSTSRSVFN